MSREPLQGATVVLPESGRGAITDPRGIFSFEEVPAGPVTVRIEMEGYTTLVESLEVLPSEISLVQFHLLPVSVVLEGLTVSADRTDRRRRGAAEAEVSGDEEGGTATDLLLRQVPGLSVTRSDGEAGAGISIRLRGVSSVSLSSEPAIYLDDVRIDEGGSSGAIDVLNQIPASLVERIRILRGSVATMRYPLAASGVIVIETRRGSEGGG
jgi:outer membrane receptor protein involved in Fe transport